MAKNQPIVYSMDAQDWIQHNDALFKSLKIGATSTQGCEFLIYTDFDETRRSQEVGVEKAFSELVDKVGDLGLARLVLVHSEMDDAWAVTLAPK